MNLCGRRISSLYYLRFALFSIQWSFGALCPYFFNYCRSGHNFLVCTWNPRRKIKLWLSQYYVLTQILNVVNLLCYVLCRDVCHLYVSVDVVVDSRIAVTMQYKILKLDLQIGVRSYTYDRTFAVEIVTKICPIKYCTSSYCSVNLCMQAFLFQILLSQPSSIFNKPCMSEKFALRLIIQITCSCERIN